MQIYLLKKEIYPLLQNVVGIIERKHNIPILSHVLINLNKGVLILTTTNSEIQIKTKNKIKNKETIIFTLYAKDLIDIIKNIDDNTTIIFTINTKEIKLKIKNNIFTLNALNYNNFPILTKETRNTQKIQCNALDLYNLIEKTSFTIANQDIRSYLNGLYIESNENKLTLVSTDGYRLSFGTIIQLNIKTKKIIAIIPKKSILEIAKLLIKANKNDLINIELSKNYLEINFKETQIISQLINSKYPNYRQVIPVKGDTLIKTKRLELLETLKNIVPIVDSNNKRIQLDIKNDTLTISAKSERGSAESNIQINSNIINLVINFNIYYLIQVLEKLKTNKINIIPPNDNGESYLFTNSPNSNYQYIIMPIKV